MCLSQVANFSPAFLNRQAILLMDALGTDQVRPRPAGLLFTILNGLGAD